MMKSTKCLVATISSTWAQATIISGHVRQRGAASTPTAAAAATIWGQVTVMTPLKAVPARTASMVTRKSIDSMAMLPATPKTSSPKVPPNKAAVCKVNGLTPKTVMFRYSAAQATTLLLVEGEMISSSPAVAPIGSGAIGTLGALRKRGGATGQSPNALKPIRMVMTTTIMM